MCRYIIYLRRYALLLLPRTSAYFTLSMCSDTIHICIHTHTYVDAYFAQSPRDSVPYIPRDTYQDFHPYASCKSGFPPFQVSWNAGFRAPKRYRTRRGAHPQRRDIMIIHLYSYAIGFSWQGERNERPTLVLSAM